MPTLFAHDEHTATNADIEALTSYFTDPTKKDVSDNPAAIMAIIQGREITPSQELALTQKIEPYQNEQAAQMTYPQKRNHLKKLCDAFRFAPENSWMYSAFTKLADEWMTRNPELDYNTVAEIYPQPATTTPHEERIYSTAAPAA